MFLDRHDLDTSVTPEQVAEAHRQDSQIQNEHGVRYHTYWFDPDDGTVFCLAEGPSREAVEEVHALAHGLMAGSLIELDPNAPLNAMLGPLPTHPVGTAYTASAVRAIVFTDVVGSVAQTQALGDEGHMQLLRVHNDIVRRELAPRDGREVKHTGDGIMASFNSVTSAVEFAVAVQKGLAEYNADAPVPLDVSIGISAGEPLTDESNDLFGATVQLAARLCAVAEAGQVATSVAVRELCIGKAFQFDDLGHHPLKGMPEPVQVYGVAWR